MISCESLSLSFARIRGARARVIESLTTNPDDDDDDAKGIECGIYDR